MLRRRAQIGRVADLGQRIGYLFLAVAVVAFAIGLLTSFRIWGPVVGIALALCTVTLAPAIVLGYGVRAAERDERGG